MSLHSQSLQNNPTGPIALSVVSKDRGTPALLIMQHADCNEWTFVVEKLVEEFLKYVFTIGHC